MKDTIERIKATCKKNKLELSLMGIFILAALILSGPKLAEEAAVLYGTPETETEQMTETEPISETEAETGRRGRRNAAVVGTERRESSSWL